MSETRTLAEFTTFRVGGPAADLTEATTREELLDFCRAHPLHIGHEGASAHSAHAVLFVGGGSNLLVSDAGFAGSVCAVRTRGIETRDLAGGEVLVTAEAGENWDEFVASCVAEGLAGLEPLSGIPGTVGSTPVQNVGAYGTEVAETIESVLVHDRFSGDELVLGARELEFAYRTSRLKRTAHEFGTVRFVVIAVRFRLRRSELSTPVRYAQLAQALDVDLGARVPLSRVRREVLALRASKGMVLDEDDHDTWSAGSFFTNPILPKDFVLPEGAPTYPVHDAITGARDGGVQKTSAAWLIDHAGFDKGFGVGAKRATLSTKHTLALTNRGSANCEDVLELARHIRDGVRSAFGITLVPEPDFIGVSL
ncbi:UDP-N-acetylmuramate dehydrogenase [Brevibacterium samyangense]|uniref:UDP-N-acetylenolpyruvoylglucosamine reductase n=1 Tax=Brevibacterium samyangense TaxID=366888 RepID=A0ABN2TI25_9MICO